MGGGVGGCEQGPGPASGEEPGEAGAPPSHLSSIPPLHFGAESSPARLLGAPLARTPGATARSPPCLPAPLQGSRHLPRWGHMPQTPLHALGWAGTPRLSCCPPGGRIGALTPPSQASSPPGTGIPLPGGRSVRFQMMMKLRWGGTGTAASPTGPWGAGGSHPLRLAARAPAFSQRCGCSGSLLAGP